MSGAWRSVPLRYLTTCLDGQRVPLNASERSERPGVVPYWGANGIQGSVDEHSFDEPLILLGEDGAPFFDRSRSVAFFVDEPIWPNNHIHVLRPQNKIDARWLTYSLNCVEYAFYISGSTRDKLTQQDMNAIDLYVPPVRRQREIADFLDREMAKIDFLILTQQSLVDSLLERRAAVITDALEAPPDGRRLKHLVKSMRQGWSPECEQVPADGVTEWGILKSGCMNGGVFRPQENKRLPEDVAPRPDSVVRKDEIVISRASTRELVGSAAVVEVDYPRLMLSDLVYAAQVDPSLAEPEYVSLLLSTPRLRGLIQAAAKGTSSSMQKVSQSDLMGLPMGVPSLSEQRRQLDELHEQTIRLDQLVATSRSLLDLLRERRAALITAAVTGHIDVTTYGGAGLSESVTT